MFRKERRTMPYRVRLQALLQICKGMGSLHERGLIHAEYASTQQALRSAI